MLLLLFVLLLLLLLLLLAIVDAVVVPLVTTRVIHDGRFQSVGVSRFVPVIGIGCGSGGRSRSSSSSRSGRSPGPLLRPLRVLLHVFGQISFLSV